MFEENITRVRMPRKGETFGIVEEILGGDKLRVRCDDGHGRICRIPGKMRKKIWIRAGDIVLIEPWKVQSNERGDVVYRYTKTQALWLKKEGHVNKLQF